MPKQNKVKVEFCWGGVRPEQKWPKASKAVENSLRDEDNKRAVEKAVLHFLKHGIKIPSSEAVIEMLAGWYSTDEIALNENDAQRYSDIESSLILLASLATVKERM